MLTELDLLAPMPDLDLVLAGPLDLNRGQRDPTLLDWDSSHMISGSIEQIRDAHDEPLALEDDDLIIDTGDDPLYPLDGDISIEAGRADPLQATGYKGNVDDTTVMYDNDDMNVGYDDGELGHRSSVNPMRREEDISMGGIDDLNLDFGEGDAPAATTAPRRSLTPLSSVRSSVARELERTFHLDEMSLQQEDEEPVRHPHKAKKRKVIQADEDTEIHYSQIRAQQNDRSRILKPASFLPRDATLLALMTMQKNGGFVSSILGDGRSQGWAPELRGILSVEVIRRSGDLKRKRDSGIADLDEEVRSTPGKSPRLQPDDEGFGGGLDQEYPEDDGIPAGLRDDYAAPPSAAQPHSDGDILSPIVDNFDDTTAPLLDPADDGPVALGTKHAVHLLREHFGGAAADTPSKRAKSSVLFHDLLPESRTTKADATKLFFEVLVLATKDAIKVEQPVDVLGGPIRLRGKRGLWGSWAETQAGGEIASQIAPTADGVAVS